MINLNQVDTVCHGSITAISPVKYLDSSGYIFDEEIT
jgi:hypothetical protein